MDANNPNKDRPCIVLSADEVNSEADRLTVLPVGTTGRGTFWEEIIPKESVRPLDGRRNPLNHISFANCGHPKTIRYRTDDLGIPADVDTRADAKAGLLEAACLQRVEKRFQQILFSTHKGSTSLEAGDILWDFAEERYFCVCTASFRHNVKAFVIVIPLILLSACSPGAADIALSAGTPLIVFREGARTAEALGLCEEIYTRDSRLRDMEHVGQLEISRAAKDLQSLRVGICETVDISPP